MGKNSFVLALLLLFAPMVAAAAERMAWWREAKFGMFIHWGVYAVPAGTYDGKPIDGIGEWIMRNGQIPVERYRKYAAEFNPTKYDPEAWAELAKEAGMKYVVITSKHHDGFALYDSAVTKWDIADATPYGKDLLTPLAQAVRKRGLKFGLYYSQAQDWTHAGGAKKGLADGEGWDEAHRGSFDAYLEAIAVPQTKEILARFQPDVLWWDTPHLMTRERAKPLHELLAAQPSIITNNRLGGGFGGDTETPEQFIPATGYGDRDWETCMTLNDTWGFKSYDHNWKSTKTLIQNLVDIVSKGGNYLLNVGPTAQGEIPQESIDRLREVGAWMKVNGGAIYGVEASPCRAPDWGRIARRGSKLYLFVFDWPSNGKLVLPVRGNVGRCGLIANGICTFTANDSPDGIVVVLTGDAPDTICSVIELETSGELKPVPQFVRQAVDETLSLEPGLARTTGKVKVEKIDKVANLGHWTESDSVAEWTCRVNQGGLFQLTAEVAAPQATAFTLECGDAKLKVEVPATGDYGAFREIDLGKLAIPTGEVGIVVRPVERGWQPVNLRCIKICPAE